MKTITYHRLSNRLRLSALSSAIACVALPALGQGSIEEVLVVATKREQTLQEVPVAVSVVSAVQMEQAQVLDIKDLQTLVPSLRVNQLQSSANTNFSIRGFGNGANNVGLEPSVGVFIDGVYRSRVGSALADLPKLDRVEVLRGPQSTLFGKNASAGVINIVTAKPDLSAYSGSVSATAGNYDQLVLRGDVTGPISEHLAFSLFGSRNQRDGYFDNLELGTEQNEMDRWNLRGQLLFVPTDRLEMRFIVDGESLDEACCGVANLVDGPTGAVVRALGGNLVPNDAFAYEGFFDFDSNTEIDTRGGSVEINYEFDSLTVTSITAYRELEQVDLGDVDYTSARLVDPTNANVRDISIDTFTQEVRLTSQYDGPFNWLAGAFFFTEDVSVDSSFLYGDQFRAYADALAGGALGPTEAFFGTLNPAITPGTFFAQGTGNPEERARQDDETWSLFLQADYELTDRLTLTVGGNYTEVEKDVSVNIVSTDVFSGLPLTGPFAPLQALQFLPPFLSYPNAVESGRSADDELTYTLRVAYDISATANVYASVGTGFKATTWNLTRDSRPFAADIPALTAAGLAPPNLTAGTRFAGPEESTVYELGLKADYDSFALNLAVFVQEIEGFQSNVFTGTGFNLANAGKQSVDGAELDLTWAPMEGLRVAFALTYLDPLYDSFPGASGVNGPTDLSGTTPAGIPEWSANTNVTYNFALAGASAYVRVEHVFEDEVQNIENVPAAIASREINLFNASFGMRFDGGWDFNLWGRNLNEDEYLQSAFPSVAQLGSFSGYPNTPRTWGLTLRKSFE